MPRVGDGGLGQSQGPLEDMGGVRANPGAGRRVHVEPCDILPEDFGSRIVNRPVIWILVATDGACQLSRILVLNTFPHVDKLDGKALPTKHSMEEAHGEVEVLNEADKGKPLQPLQRLRQVVLRAADALLAVVRCAIARPVDKMITVQELAVDRRVALVSGQELRHQAFGEVCKLGDVPLASHEMVERRCRPVGGLSEETHEVATPGAKGLIADWPVVTRISRSFASSPKHVTEPRFQRVLVGEELERALLPAVAEVLVGVIHEAAAGHVGALWQ